MAGTAAARATAPESDQAVAGNEPLGGDKGERDERRRNGEPVDRHGRSGVAERAKREAVEAGEPCQGMKRDVRDRVPERGRDRQMHARRGPEERRVLGKREVLVVRGRDELDGHAQVCRPRHR